MSSQEDQQYRRGKEDRNKQSNPKRNKKQLPEIAHPLPPTVSSDKSVSRGEEKYSLRIGDVLFFLYIRPILFRALLGLVLRIAVIIPLESHRHIALGDVMIRVVVRVFIPLKER